MTLDELKQEYQSIKNQESYAKFFKFSKQLTSSHEDTFLDYHLHIIGETENNKILQVLANAFTKRGKSAEQYLLKKINQEKDSRKKGMILQMLGKMGSTDSIPHALDFIESEDSNLQYRGIIVIGWVGTPNELEHLEEILLSHNNPEIRGYAATAMRQIWFRLPEVKDSVINSLQKALNNETTEETLSSIIIVLQDILKKKFGLKEDIDEGKINGNITLAKSKALKVLEAV